MSFLLEDFGGQFAHINELPADNPLLKNGLLVSETFTRMVDMLRNPTTCRNDHINKLMSLFWDLVGNRITPTAVTTVPTLSFWCEIKKGRMFACILVPINWCEMVKADHAMQLGALVFNASKAKDYWNLKVPGLSDAEQNLKARAYSYEAELLLGVPNLSPNDYQTKVLEKYYDGVATKHIAGVHYESREFPGEGPPFPLDFDSLKGSQ